jgi:MFS family permease
MREIYIGAALLYLIGFGIVCFRVKEGEYPPPEDIGKQPSFLAQLRVYGRECYTSRYYRDIYLNFAFGAMSGALGWATVFNMESLGLDLTLYGHMGAICAVFVPVCLVFTGPLVDHWNPVRVQAHFCCAGAFLVFGDWVWLLIAHPPPMLIFWFAIIGAVFSAFPTAMNSILELPRLVQLFPQERYGQFSGAIALCHGPAGILCGFLAGYYLDFWMHFFPKA